MTTGFLNRATATTRNSLGGKTVRTPVSLPTDVGDAQRSLSTGTATVGPGRPRIGVPVGDRRRIGTLIGGLAAIFLVLTIAAVAARHIHVTPVTTTPSTPTATANAARANTTDVSRLAGATTAVASATASATAAAHGLQTYGGFATPQQLSTALGPYVDTLELYQTVLAATPAPASATKAVRALDTQLRTDIATFGTAGAVSRDHLGPFLDSVLVRAAVFQTSASTLQRTLHPHVAHH